MANGIQKFKPQAGGGFKVALLWVATFAAIGFTTLLFTHAATQPTEPSNGTNNGTDTTCVFQKADQPMQQAFCEDFDSAVTTNPAGSRSGDLNNTLWGVSRVGPK